MHAVTTTAERTAAGWLVRAACTHAGIAHSRPAVVGAGADGPDEYAHRIAAQAMAARLGLEGIWHGGPLGPGRWVYVWADGPNGSFTVGEGYAEHDDPYAPWMQT